MSTNNKSETSIHQFDFNLICEYFSSISRQGPGSEDMTIKAIDFLEGLDSDSSIADLGCGTGSQTFSLLQHTPCSVTALDLFPQFIDILKDRVKSENVGDRLTPIVGSMEDMPFSKEQFDVIWSEGAIYNIGFKRGLQEWKYFLKSKGYIAVTEASWLTNSRPDDIARFWEDAYPEIDTIPNKVQQMQNVGYKSIATFVLPEKCWTDNYYIPQVQAQRAFLERHKGNVTAEELIKNQRHEAELYSKYKQYYGYVFYIGRKLD